MTVVAAGAVTAAGHAGTRRHRGQVVPAAEQVLVAVVQRGGPVAVARDEVVVVKVLRLLLMTVPRTGSVGNLRHDQRSAAGKVRRAEGLRVAEGRRSERCGEDGVDSGRASAPHRHGTISLFPAAAASVLGRAGFQHGLIVDLVD